jgi:hypothetical protein
MYKHIPVLVAALCSAVAMADTSITSASTKVDVESTSAAAKTAAMSNFETLDKNGDERISRTEAGMDKNLSNTFGIADTDGDGYVSKAEFMSRPQG